MKILAPSFLLTLVLCLMFSGEARADVKDIYASNNAFSFDFGLDNQEFSTSGTTDEGWMPTFGVALSYMPHAERSSWFLNKLYMQFGLMVDIGDTDYSGTSSGTTSNTVLDLEGRLGRGFVLSDSVLITPFAALGFRTWDRESDGPIGGSDEYSHGTFLAGMMAQYSPAPMWVVSFTGEYGTTLSPAAGSVDLGTDTVWKLGAKVGYAVTKRIELTASAQMSNFKYGRSSLGTGELDSETDNFRGLIGINYRYPP